MPVRRLAGRPARRHGVQGKPTTRRTKLMVRTAVLALAGLAAALVVPLTSHTASAAGSDLAAGKAVAASSANGQYAATNINDGNQDTYWESANGTFPQWAQVDLGTSASISQVVLKLPAAWGARSETLTLQGSPDGTNFSTIVASAAYSFDPSAGNTVPINFGAVGSSRVDLQACKLEYSIVSPK